jgi:predicted RND superfamily exporter protein
MVPGMVALTTDAIGFLTIYIVPIGVVRDVALTASIGVACIIVANGLVLTLILSYLPNLLSSEEVKPASEQIKPYLSRLLTGISHLTYGRNAYRVTAVAFVLLLIGFFHARTVTVGDVNPGEPLLWEDSVYNLDAAKIMADYQLGIDWLSVVVTGDGDGTCKDYGILEVLQDYEWKMGSVPGTTVVISPLGVATAVNEMLHEGNMLWRALPKDRRELGYCFYNAGSGDDSEFMDMGCQSINIRIFLSDHKGDTIRRMIQKTKAFIAENPLSGARYVLAGGNAGVMAATNEVVDESEVRMLLLVYLTIFILCMFMFRSLKGPLLILAPLFLVSILSTAFMKLFDLGLNVNTLPVATLGVGIGVDYGIYVYSRLKEERQRHTQFPGAVNTTLHTTGAAVLFTASAKSVSVLIWLLSDLKFQADMGLLLGFIYIANLIGAVVLMPALVYVFDVKDKENYAGELPYRQPG